MSRDLVSRDRGRPAVCRAELRRPSGRHVHGDCAGQTDGEPRAGAHAAGDVDLAADRLRPGA